MSEPESHPKRIHKPSSRLRRAQGMDTDSDDENDDFTPTQQLDNTAAAPSSVMMSTPAPPASVPSSVQRTQSTTSVVSQTSVIATTRTEDDKRRAKFDERFKTAKSTEEEVLRTFPQLSKHLIVSDCFEERQMATWTSDVYTHFRMPPAVSVRRGIIVYTYTCITCVVYVSLTSPT